MMTDRQINALAAFIADGRPDWQPQGIAAALRACRDDYDGWQLAAAMIRRASKPGNRTPQLQDFDHAEPRIACPDHPSAGVRLDGTCGGCWANRHQAGPVPEKPRTPPPAPLRQLVAAARPVTETTADV